MRRFKKILLGLLIVLILIQFIQPTQNKSREILSTDLTKTINVPENVQSILKTACYDCHSNNTRYPWYSRLQPFGWLLARHIKNGKVELNFSEFDSYSLRRQVSKLNEITNSTKDGTMPLGSYTMIHPKARLSGNEKELLIDWATRTKDSLRLNK
jgi:Haem-binding domain